MYAKQGQFKSLNTRTQWVCWIFGISMLVYVIAVLSDFAQAGLLNRAIAGETITWSEVMANDTRQGVIGFAIFVLFIAEAISFLMWVHRAHKNLPSLGATDLRFTPGWVVGWFFIPIMCLFRPYQAVAEISKASDPKVDATDGASWKSVAALPLVGWWWAFFIISNYVAFMVARVALSMSYSYSTELSDFLFATYATIVSEAINILYLFIAILMVRRISQSQEIKNRLVSPSVSGYKTPTFQASE